MTYKKRTSPDGKPLWMPIWIADRVADTGHLSAFDLGCLHRLELSYWRSGPLADCNDTLARICGCTPVEFRRARISLGKFFDIGSGQWISQKIDMELAESYRVINLKRNQTAAATNARIAKRNEQRKVERNNLRNVDRNDSRRDNVTNNVTGNQLQVNGNTPLAKAGIRLISLDDPDVSAAVAALENKCEAHHV